ncbi:monovalent cation/H+ antiporter subunit D [Thiosulfatimonas sediminis]|uniref:Monovalent cation/H+ antiporter subunit D n=1 Tax=Thiosulfatimonas sediminis TaxID=2675054 RepID=A0A6F8PRC8_9GAMM|nr:monovalent cation/H+ antiporter subunit D [Thiosulfatimonas sediminis]BBP44683.1 monovalent cation/H+ antiporter subunit D [Thiosulfatimonas sediminis]
MNLNPVIWSLLLPLLSAIVLLLLSQRIKWQRSISLFASSSLVLITFYAMGFALSSTPQTYALGNWPAPFGIILVLDQLSGLLLVITALLSLAALWCAVRQNTDQQGVHFHVLWQLQIFGLNGAFLTGDLFNLFVFFEVLLLASYGLLLHGGRRQNTKAGLHYVVINLLASSLFLFAVGTLYGILGTLNMADLAQKIAHLPADNQPIVAAAGLLLLVVFAVKSALFPLYLWLPKAYANTTAPVAALFAIMTKVGVYAIIRVHGMLFGENAGALAGLHLPWLLWLGLITLLLAAFGTLAATTLRQTIAYLVLASVATLLIAIGINQTQTLPALLFYLIHSTFIAAGLFLLADYVRQGRPQHADRLIADFAMPRNTLIGGVYLFAAIAISGMPPLSGFFGKLLILQSSIQHPYFWWILATILLSNLLIIIALVRVGSVLFYQTLPRERCHDSALQTQCLPPHINPQGCGAIVGLLSIGILLTLFAQPIYQITESISAQWQQVTLYQQQVLTTAPFDNPNKTLYWEDIK